MTNPSNPTPTTNKIGLSRADYVGGKSTLCTGCGHDSITNNIISSLFQSGVNPYHIAKMSGIGCSSKTPGYFLNKSHGFNSVHGRMAPVATGAKVAQKQLKMIGISGDGDTASIGMGGFVHMIRRNLPIVYIVANNGVYGLTKGQFSATAELGAKQKSGLENPFGEIDLCSLAVTLGCSFVARSFSGDAKQLIPLIQSAMHHNGTAVIDVISPCITFNNLATSLKSYEGFKEHKISLQELGFIESREEIKVDYAEGTIEEVELPDGTFLTLKKIDPRAHNFHDRISALSLLETSRKEQHIVTGLIYIDPHSLSLIDQLNLTKTPLAQLSEDQTRLSKDNFKKFTSLYK